MSDQRISWDQYFIAQAAILSTRSTVPACMSGPSWSKQPDYRQWFITGPLLAPHTVPISVT